MSLIKLHGLEHILYTLPVCLFYPIFSLSPLSFFPPSLSPFIVRFFCLHKKEGLKKWRRKESGEKKRGKRNEVTHVYGMMMNEKMKNEKYEMMRILPLESSLECERSSSLLSPSSACPSFLLFLLFDTFFFSPSFPSFLMQNRNEKFL